ncbi:uncharacterized protein [Arachis hypogaea]|uniref:uncharacterized protein n=1 Tax=Arachis hypogaea TaxID=3818 RepID=UPI000DEC6B9A|nr:uncharacterized protein LOC112742966 [Arachis hypogaea]
MGRPPVKAGKHEARFGKPIPDQGLVKEPMVTLCITQAADTPSWMDPITDFLENGKLPKDEKAAKVIRGEAAKYVIVQGQLFKRGLHQPLLKSLRPDQTDYVLSEVHEGCCGHHIGGKALARKLVRAGYYWPSMMSDSLEFVKRCKKFQENANFYRTPAVELSLLMASRPFSQWGVDLLGPFPVGPGQVKTFRISLMVLQNYTTILHRGNALPAYLWGRCSDFRGGGGAEPTVTPCWS